MREFNVFIECELMEVVYYDYLTAAEVRKELIAEGWPQNIVVHEVNRQ